MLRPLLLLTLPLALAGCGSLLTEATADVAGVTGAATASAVTKDAAVAAAIGLGVQSAANEGLKYVERRVHGAEQDAIATAAGPLAPGAVAAWSISHDLPIERDAAGEVTVSREFGAMAFHCKEIVFSIDRGQDPKGGKDGDGTARREFYTATVCQDGPAWRWASAEPSTARWGGIQ